jgi:hypothetical protein
MHQYPEHWKPPYLMSREEWKAEVKENKANWVQTNYTRHTKSQEISRLNRLIFLYFDVGEWLYDKACKGEEWAQECLDYSYDKYAMIIKKAKEEGLLPIK